MTQIVLASVVVLGMALIVIFGLTRVFRGRKYTMVDYPELPSPSPDDKPDASPSASPRGPTMNA